MNESDSIVPLCLYKNEQGGSYLTIPSLENGQYVCQSISGLDLVVQFYGVNPDFRPIPAGVDLLCANNSGYRTVNVTQIYDPYNLDEGCVRFMAWLEPVPYATPIYVSKGKTGTLFGLGRSSEQQNSLDISLEKPSDDVDYFSLYVLLQKDFPNGFRFSNYQGRCLPDPNGKTLAECSVVHGKNLKDPYSQNNNPTLLDYLGKTNSQPIKFNFTFLTIAVFLVTTILLFVIVRKKATI